MPINIIVCIKQVLDPEAPVSSFKIDPEAKRAIPAKGTPPVLNPFDENALELALKLKDKQPAVITVLSMGPKLSALLLRKALAAGADNLILLEDPLFDSFDSFATATVLAAAVKKIGTYDIILCGREAADTDSGQVGNILAEMLGIPAVTVAQKLAVENGKVTVDRVLSDGYEIIESGAPVLVTASNEAGELRSPPVKNLMEAQRRPVTTWRAADLGVTAALVKYADMAKLFIPSHTVQTEIIKEETPEASGQKLALKLREAKII